ncbi:MAG: hypothetical protein Tsb0016_03050 [Sphingomonadales bacterium]
MFDQQINLADGPEQRFLRQVSVLPTLSAVERGSTVMAFHYPRQQQVRVHRVWLWREGKALDVAGRVIVQERNETAQLPMAQASEQVVTSYHIPDVRPGDMLEFAATVIGDTPGLDNMRSGNFASGSLAPIRQMHHRILTANTAPIEIYLRGGHSAPQITEHDGLTEYVWNNSNAKIEHFSLLAPPWHHHIPIVQYSGAQGWEDVARWATPLFRPPQTPYPEIVAQVQSLIANASTDRERLDAITAFVQEQIRYLGPGLSRNGYVPFDPKEVLERRWGDCKDQTVLTLTMLGAAGIQAWPALTNLSQGYVDPEMPTPLAFDHVLVIAKIGNEQFWIDPTRRARGQNRASFEPPSTNLALFVQQPREAALVSPPPATTNADGYHIDFTETIDLIDGHQLSLSASFAGDYADAIRLMVEQNGTSQIVESYAAVLQAYGEDIESHGDARLTEDDLDNVIHFAQNFRAGSLWAPKKDKRRHEARIAPKLMLEFLPNISGSEKRTAPLALNHPFAVREIQIVRIPSFIELDASGHLVERDAYTLRLDLQRQGHALTLTTSMKTHRDYLTADEIGQFREDIAELKSWAYEINVNSDILKARVLKPRLARKPAFDVPLQDLINGAETPRLN